MSVNFAAVHDRNPWRKHQIHQSLTAAIDGKDGVRSLLLRRGRVADMWRKYGALRCVFAWDDQADFAEAFRLDPGSGNDVQSVQVAVDRVLQFDEHKYCTSQEISECFAGQSGPKTENPRLPSMNVVANRLVAIPYTLTTFPKVLHTQKAWPGQFWSTRLSDPEQHGKPV